MRPGTRAASLHHTVAFQEFLSRCVLLLVVLFGQTLDLRVGATLTTKRQISLDNRMADNSNQHDSVHVSAESSEGGASAQQVDAAGSMAAASAPPSSGGYGAAAPAAGAHYAPPASSGAYGDYAQYQAPQDTSTNQEPAQKLFVGQLSRSMTDDQVCGVSLRNPKPKPSCNCKHPFPTAPSYVRGNGPNH